MTDKQIGLHRISIMQQHGIQFPKNQEIQQEKFCSSCLGPTGNTSSHQPQVYIHQRRQACPTYTMNYGMFSQKSHLPFFSCELNDKNIVEWSRMRAKSKYHANCAYRHGPLSRYLPHRSLSTPISQTKSCAASVYRSARSWTFQKMPRITNRQRRGPALSEHQQK